jgi:hypothetical protein
VRFLLTKPSASLLPRGKLTIPETFTPGVARQPTTLSVVSKAQKRLCYVTTLEDTLRGPFEFTKLRRGREWACTYSITLEIFLKQSKLHHKHLRDDAPTQKEKCEDNCIYKMNKTYSVSYRIITCTNKYHHNIQQSYAIYNKYHVN